MNTSEILDVNRYADAQIFAWGFGLSDPNVKQYELYYFNEYGIGR